MDISPYVGMRVYYIRNFKQRTGIITAVSKNLQKFVFVDEEDPLEEQKFAIHISRRNSKMYGKWVEGGLMGRYAHLYQIYLENAFDK